MSISFTSALRPLSSSYSSPRCHTTKVDPFFLAFLCSVAGDAVLTPTVPCHSPLPPSTARGLTPRPITSDPKYRLSTLCFSCPDASLPRCPPFFGRLFPNYNTTQQPRGVFGRQVGLLFCPAELALRYIAIFDIFFSCTRSTKIHPSPPSPLTYISSLMALKPPFQVCPTVRRKVSAKGYSPATGGQTVKNQVSFMKPYSVDDSNDQFFLSLAALSS